MKDTSESILIIEQIDDLRNRHKLPYPIYITQPRMPNLEEYKTKYLQDIWQSRWLTNDGQFHQEFEKRLKKYLRIEHCCKMQVYDYFDRMKC